ncbi:MAG: AAA family ATPase [Rhodoferax sp.]|nr:AAA family ATPase [Rhodoferax sp.]
MLKSIHLQNFRRHTNACFGFGEGLSVVRAPNEAGKSTIGEAIAYALFGVKTLRSPLAETVTWGNPESSLKVMLTLTLDGVEYKVTRSKSGCECTYSDQIVTGQTEVSNFLASRLKVDASSAAKLMLANQNAIRGALESGTKATTELIEQLAEFDQIDNLIELMQEKLLMGSPASATAQLESAGAVLERAQGVQEPDFVSLESGIKSAQSDVDSATKEEAKSRKKYEAALQNHTRIQSLEAQRKRAGLAAAQAHERLDKAIKDQELLVEHPVDDYPNPDEKIADLLKAKASGVLLADSFDAYRAVQPLLHKQAMEYHAASMSDLEAEIDTLRTQNETSRNIVRKHDVEIAALQAKINSGSCSFCGQDFSEVPEVKAQNAKLAEAIASIEEEILDLNSGEFYRTTRISALTTTRTLAKPYIVAAQRYAMWLKVDDSTVPPMLTWAGAVPDVSVTVQPNYDQMIKDIRSAVKARADYLQAVHTASLQAAHERSALGDAERVLKELGPVEDVGEAHTTVQTLHQEARDAAIALSEAKALERHRGHALEDAKKDWARACADLAKAKLDVEAAQQRLTELEFNNALIKRVRQCRPLIADQLWRLTLAAVSSYFSEMRGARSVVSKGSDGFTVDDHTVASLSGSTLDILGLAIRVALVRTFLPSAPFLLLDEPMSGCDAERTEALLGFLSTVGFRQVILISHEDVSESVADHIITLAD